MLWVSPRGFIYQVYFPVLASSPLQRESLLTGREMFCVSKICSGLQRADRMFWLYINYQLDALIFYLFIKYYIPLHVSSLKCPSSGGYNCIHAAYVTVTLYESSWWPVGTQIEWEHKLCTYKPPGTLVESDSTICCMYTTVSSWRWALKARNV